jgi:hypothetical protein
MLCQKLQKEQNKMAELKHIGRVVKTGKKVLVAFRTLPGASDRCLVVPTESLPDSYHDALINLVESNAGQSANEFAEVLARTNFPDGTIMLAALHSQGRMISVGTSEIEMCPTNSHTVILSELNSLIAEQKGVTVDSLAVQRPLTDPNIQVRDVATIRDVDPPKSQPLTPPTTDAEPLTDDAVAKKYRSDADRLSKEAAQLRRMAEDLVPTKKKVSAVE